MLKVGLKQLRGYDKFGSLITYHRGGGCKRKYIFLDFYKHENLNKGKVLNIFYDPNRSSFLALICYSNGILSYMIAPEGLKKNDNIYNFLEYKLLKGNSIKLSKIVKGDIIFNLGYNLLNRGKLIRSAGTKGLALNRFLDKYLVIKLPSGELRGFSLENYCTRGSVSNKNLNLKKKKKAGINRYLNKRPVVRGVAMNPVDHPHGGGEGKSSGGIPKTPWGFLTKGGFKTRKKNKKNKMIIKRK